MKSNVTYIFSLYRPDHLRDTIGYPTVVAALEHWLTQFRDSSIVPRLWKITRTPGKSRTRRIVWTDSPIPVKNHIAAGELRYAYTTPATRPDHGCRWWGPTYMTWEEAWKVANNLMGYTIVIPILEQSSTSPDTVTVTEVK